MTEFDVLEKQREQIDAIDYEILILLKRRFQTAKKIAETKREKNMEIFQPDRESYVLQNRISKGVEMGITESFTRNLFQNIIDESKKEQQKLIDKLENKNN